jgi:hypothetical protein
VRDAVQQPGQQVEVLGHPLQGRVGDQHVDRRAQRERVRLGPLTQVADLPPDAVDLARGRDHLGTAVDAGDLRAPPPLGQQRGEGAGTAAEVDDDPRALGGHPGEQVDERPAALVGVREVAVGVPGVAHARPPQVVGRSVDRPTPSPSGYPGTNW